MVAATANRNIITPASICTSGTAAELRRRAETNSRVPHWASGNDCGRLHNERKRFSNTSCLAYAETTGAQSHTNLNLAVFRDSAGQNQIRNVRASDNEKAS